MNRRYASIFDRRGDPIRGRLACASTRRTVLVQFKLWVCMSPKGAYFITLPIPPSRQQAYFCL